MKNILSKNSSLANYNERLVEEYSVSLKKIQAGNGRDYLRVMNIGYALDAVDFAQQFFKVTLDFSDESIEDIEKILDVIHKTLVDENSKEEDILNYAKKFSGYIGQVIIKSWGGEWKDENEYSFKNKEGKTIRTGPGLKVKDLDIFILSKVYRRIVNGSEDSITQFYQGIKENLE